MTSTTTDVMTIPPLCHDEAMALAEVEYGRFVDLVRRFGADDWTMPTDCTLWDVRAMVGHNLGNIEAAASVRETARQQIKAARRAKRDGMTSLDAMATWCSHPNTTAASSPVSSLTGRPTTEPNSRCSSPAPREGISSRAARAAGPTSSTQSSSVEPWRGGPTEPAS